MSFETFYKNTYRFVYKFFYYRVLDKSIIEDLAHDVFIRFYKKYQQEDFSSDQYIKLLFGFCKNIYKEYACKCMKEPKAELFENYDYSYYLEITADSPAIEQKNTQHILLIQAINTLSPKVKLVIESRFLYGMTRKETAALLDMGEKDVHTYQKRGIKYIQKYINNS